MTAASTAPVDIRREFVALLPRLRRFALTLSASVDEADELVQAACARAIIKGQCPTDDNPSASWLFQLIRRVSSDMAKKRKPKPREPAGETSDKAGTEQQHAVLAMPPGQASAFLLVEIEGFSYAEAAQILGIPTERLASHLCAARLSFAARDATSAKRRA
ncbi:MAG: RNA polymerase sigma factor [Rhizobiales bacterium]|nr:RNA polymerase sigma factor [Hyphomicrobiales bacterium]